MQAQVSMLVKHLQLMMNLLLSPAYHMQKGLVTDSA